MKNTKILTVAATVLMGASIAVPAMAATPTGDANANGGQALPQTGTTTAGISFGNSGETPNQGTLRLYKVPSILDFGNHATFDGTHPNFNAKGQNLGMIGNNTHASYDETDSNKTSVNAATGLVYTQVVDDQTERQLTAENPEIAGKYDNKAGSWTLYVKSEGPLTSKENKQLAGTSISFKNGVVPTQQSTSDVTGQAGSPAGTKPSYMNQSIVLDMEKMNEVAVQKAAADEGAGVSEANWTPENIVINVPATGNAKVADGAYMGKLTWTLKSDVTL